MKPFLITIGILFFVGIITAALFFIFSRNSQKNSISDSGANLTLPTATTDFTAPSSQQASSTQLVAQAFQNQLPQLTNDTSFTLGQAVIVFPYAIQNWGTSNEGGQALFQYDSSKGWVLLSGGGGAWTVSSLVSDKGVPQAIAEQLVAGLPSNP